jgi:hypothetical protein
MTKEDCRANALKCYRIAQTATDREVRHMLFGLAVQWRELADQIERLSGEQIAASGTRGGQTTLH